MKQVTDTLLNLINSVIFGTLSGGDFGRDFGSDFSHASSQQAMFEFDLYTVTLASGQALRFTSADFDIADGLGNLWSSKGLRIDEKNSKVLAHWKVGLDTDTWVVVVMPRPIEPLTNTQFPDQINGIPWLYAAQGGALDSADWQIDRAIFASLPTWPMPNGGAVPTGGIIYGIFAGVVGAVDTWGTAAVFTINDYRSLCSISMPWRLFQGQCPHTLFDIGCTANFTTLPAASFAVNGQAIGGTTSASIQNTLPAPAGSGTYVQGRIVMTSGQCNGFARTITGWNGPGQPFTLLTPFSFAVSSGDTFTVYPGCAKTIAACTSFGNLPNFAGEAFIPAPETAA